MSVLGVGPTDIMYTWGGQPGLHKTVSKKEGREGRERKDREKIQSKQITYCWDLFLCNVPSRQTYTKRKQVSVYGVREWEENLPSLLNRHDVCF